MKRQDEEAAYWWLGMPGHRSRDVDTSLHCVSASFLLYLFRSTESANR